MFRISEDLRARGVRRLMVERGGKVLTQFLTAGLTDELHWSWRRSSWATPGRHRFVGDGSFPWNLDRRAELAEVHRLGDVVLLRYALSDRFDRTEEEHDVPAQAGRGLLRFLLPGCRGIGLRAKLDAYGLHDARPRHVRRQPRARLQRGRPRLHGRPPAR